MDTFDVIVVGGGPAGMAAARRALESGASVALVDDNPHPGGQIWRADRGALASSTSQWLASTATISSARVFAAARPGVLAMEAENGKFVQIGYRHLILATGARERFLPFPGWTLPNVMGAGGLQALAKSGLPVEGKRIVVAGSGPLLLAVAVYLKRHGAKVAAIAEQADSASVNRFALKLLRKPQKLAQAIGLRASLGGIPYRTACWPVTAQGSAKVESVKLRRGIKVWTEPCDYLACGFGLIPNTELAELLGCKIGANGIEADDHQRTSIENVYAAGEATGIGGLDLALAEGEIAGFVAANNIAAARKCFAARDSHRRFAAELDRAFALREELKSLPVDKTLVCRCEDVSFGSLKKFSGWRDAKLHTRCGMGPCQGRVCGPAIEYLLGWKPASVRPPLFPARVESLSKSGAVPPS